MQEILLPANVELRTSVIITRPGGRDSRVNFHVIFSNDVDPNAIEEHFLRELKFTAEASPGDPDERWSLTLGNLEDLGQKLKQQHKQFQLHTDRYIGMMNAVVAHEEVTSVLERQRSRFRDQYLIVVPVDEDLSKCSWDGQGHLARKLLIQKSHMLFSSNPGTRDFGLGKKHAARQDFESEFKSFKPCIHGSDAHDYNSLFEPAEGRHLWIKACLTFQGLQQLLHEPAGRVHMGNEPPCLLRMTENATKYISIINFEPTQQAQQGETWFSGKVLLNHGLVAIIGTRVAGRVHWPTSLPCSATHGVRRTSPS